jgi:hypothetical protein
MRGEPPVRELPARLKLDRIREAGMVHIVLYYKWRNDNRLEQRCCQSRAEQLSGPNKIGVKLLSEPRKGGAELLSGTI